MTNPPDENAPRYGGYPPHDPATGPPPGYGGSPPPPGPPPQGPPPQGPPVQGPAYPIGPPSGEPMPQQFPGAAAGGAPAPGQPGYAPTEPGQPPATEQPKKPPHGIDERGRVRSGKVSGLWIGVVAVAVVLILLIIFIGQNLDRVTIHFLGWSGSFPVGLVALISAVVGVLIAAIPGSIRILQLRTALKRNVKKEQRTPPAA